LAFFEVPASISRALSERNYIDATPVQKAVLDAQARERDLLVSAQTGSGKTVAYGLALAETLLAGAETFGPPGEPLALIIAPTRELAIQVRRELSWLYDYAGARVAACVGGMDPGAERRELFGGVHIVVGTPGRLRDHLERRALKVNDVKAVVLDEADEMLDMGFREDLQFILETTPNTRRTLLFSATLPKAIVTLARHYQRDALRVETRGETGGHADIEYRAVKIDHGGTERAIVNLLRFIEPASALIFCNTRQSVRHLEATLNERGFNVVSLSGELSQSERNHALQALRDGKARVCVATDVAARGIDLPNLSLVIHAELPGDAQVLQHRSGRTGRAGRKGISILLVPAARRRKAEELLARARVTFYWSEPPSADDIRKLDTDRLLQNPILSEPSNNNDTDIVDALLAMYQPRAVAAAFVKLYWSRLAAPEEVSEATAPVPRSHREAGLKKGPRNRGHQADRPTRLERQDNKSARREHSQTGAAANGPWFMLNVGRERNADPKWLLPEICRQGEITKQEIGAIRVYDKETRFQVDASVAEKFTALVAARGKGGIRIFAAPGNSGDQSLPRAPQANRENKPTKELPFAGDTRQGRPFRQSKAKRSKKFLGNHPKAK
jgi:ATP-dependent RNA helicase DeaD